MPLTADIAPLPPADELERTWRALEGRANGSFFTSWVWIGNWLDQVVRPQLPGLQAGLLGVRDADAVRGLAIVCRRPVRAVILPWATTFINQTGDREDDSIWIEYNGILSERGFESATAAAAARACTGRGVFAAGPWRSGTLRWSGIRPETAASIEAAGLRIYSQIRESCFWVDLTTLGEGLDGYLCRLSANTRRQVRRAHALLSAQGPLTLEWATPVTAAAIFAEMKSLHVAAWRARAGHDGAFARAPFERFARAVIANGLPNGAVELVRIATPAHTIGVLMNFSFRGQVFNYQAGFRQFDDNRIKPGLVCHALCVAACRARGNSAYHFMAGGGRYKESLGPESEDLVWLHAGQDNVFQRISWAARRVRDAVGRR